MSDRVIGIDVGGTKILAAVVNREGQILASKKTRTPTGLTFAEALPHFKDLAEEAMARIDMDWEAIAGVGLAIPSAIDPATGKLRHAPNLGWRDEPAFKPCGELFDRPVAMGNDVSCGLFAEYLYGAARGSTSAGGFFVGTGLGGGVVLEGQLLEGPHGLAGELGHMVVKFGGRKCGCGNRGCLEAYCSKVAFGKRFHKLIVNKERKSILTDLVGTELANVRSRDLREAFQAGDDVVCSVLNKAMRKLGAGAASLTACVDVDCIVFGGGVIEALGPELLPEIQAGFEAHLFGLSPAEVTLKLSELGDDAVPLGAAAIAWRLLEGSNPP